MSLFKLAKVFKTAPVPLSVQVLCHFDDLVYLALWKCVFVEEVVEIILRCKTGEIFYRKLLGFALSLVGVSCDVCRCDYRGC